jgi:hypothetical protein
MKLSRSEVVGRYQYGRVCRLSRSLMYGNRQPIV